MTAWDREEDATDFAGALPVVRPDAHIERRADHVLVILGPAGPAGPSLERVAARVWERTRFQPGT